MDNTGKGKYDIFVGYAAEDKVYTSNILKVYAPEILPMSKDCKDKTAKQSITYTDNKKKLEFTESMDETNIINTVYFDLATNRSGPPDIRRGEQVFVFHYADTDKYFWYPMGRDDNLRRLERVRYSISDDTRIQKELDDDNTYYIEMDTLHSKHIRIKTSKSDGESYVYKIYISSITNSITICDDIGNEILLESDVPRIRVKNSDSSFVDVFQEDVIIGAPRDVIIKAGRQILLTAPSLTSSVGGFTSSTGSGGIGDDMVGSGSW